METKSCQNCKKNFEIAPKDFAFYKKIEVPPPTFCPECRAIRRLVWRNERALFRRKCDATGVDIFTMFHPAAPFKVYEREYWWSDAWDAIDHGRDYDFSKPFFDQFRQLMHDVPWFSRSVNEMVNSDYTMNAGWLKDCYMVFDASYNEHCLYSAGLGASKDSSDLLACEKCELCYDSFWIGDSYKVLYSSESDACRDSFFLKNCTNCSNCIASINLRNKQYHIFNEPYSKEEYEKKLLEMRLDTHSGREALKKKFQEFSQKFPVKALQSTRNVNTSGEYIYNSKNVHDSYLVYETEDARYCQLLQTRPVGRDLYDASVFGSNSELIYESLQGFIDVSRLFFTNYMYPASHDCEYSIACPSSSYLFGCIGLKKKQYCIFNKQYTKEEYEALVPKIKAHMNELPFTDVRGNTYRYGEFFPFEFSPFAYNETIAQDYFPVTPEQCKESGWLWREAPERNYTITRTPETLPETSAEANPEIISDVIGCSHAANCSHGCSRAFRITPDELAFYQRLSIPLPRLCFSCRHAERMTKRNPMKIFDRLCAKCSEPIKTSYSPDREVIVYCESCYQSEVA